MVIDRGLPVHTTVMKFSKKEHDAHGDKEGDVFVFEGRSTFEKPLVQTDTEEHSKEDYDDERKIRVEAYKRKNPVTDVSEKDDDRSVGKKHDTHGAEDEAQSDGGYSVDASEKYAVYQKLNDKLKAEQFEH